MASLRRSASSKSGLRLNSYLSKHTVLTHIGAGSPVGGDGLRVRFLHIWTGLFSNLLLSRKRQRFILHHPTPNAQHTSVTSRRSLRERSPPIRHTVSQNAYLIAQSHPIPVVILLQNLHLVVHLARQSIVHLCSIEIKQHLSLTRHTALATRAYTIIVKSVPIRPFLLKSGTIRLQWSLIIKACLNEQAGVSFDPHFLENGV